jgi:ankyrin repeat protein
MLLMLTAGLVNGAEDRELGQAIQKNDLAKVKELIAADPQRLNKQVPFNSYPLFMAIDKFNVPMIKYLLEQGAKANIADEKGETVLTKLVLVNFNDANRFATIKEIFQLLCANKANVKQPNKSGKTPLYLLAGRSMGKSTLPMKIEFMKLLIDKGARPRGQDKAETPLLFQSMGYMKNDEDSQRNVIDTVTFLVENGAEVDAADDKGNTFLVRVITSDAFTEANKIELIGVLVGHGANIRKKNNEKKTPLDLVAKGDPLYEAMRKKPGRK